MTHLKYNTGGLLSNTNKAKIFGGLFGREESNEGVVFKENECTPRFEEGKEFQSGQSALDRGKAAIGGGGEEVSREEGVLLEDKDDLVTVEPSVPEAGVNGAEGPPERDQGGLTGASGEEQDYDVMSRFTRFVRERLVC